MQSIAELTHAWAEQRQVQVELDPQTGSTNDNAKANASSEGFDFVLYLADHQTRGRGRGKNTWLDTGAGESLLGTWSYALKAPPQAITAPRIGLAVYSACKEVWPSLSWGLKAPNDLYLGGKKVGGLLVESIGQGGLHRLMIGLGLNVHNHPRAIADATHISEASGHAVDEGEWFRFLDTLRSEFNETLADVVQPTLSAESCKDLATALNANSARKFDVTSVSPQGDLLHKGGSLRWTDL